MFVCGVEHCGAGNSTVPVTPQGVLGSTQPYHRHHFIAFCSIQRRAYVAQTAYNQSCRIGALWSYCGGADIYTVAAHRSYASYDIPETLRNLKSRLARRCGWTYRARVFRLWGTAAGLVTFGPRPGSDEEQYLV